MRTHRVNVTYLVVGLVFLGISASWALREAGLMDQDRLRWFLPLVLVVAGAAGLAASFAKSLRRDEPDTPDGSETAAGSPDTLLYGPLDDPQPGYGAELTDPPRADRRDG